MDEKGFPVPVSELLAQVDEIMVGLYNNAFDINSTNYISLSESFRRIKEGASRQEIENLRKESNSKKRAELKKSTLRCITYAGRFSKHDDDSLIEATGLIPLDFDKVPDPASFRDLLARKIPWIIAAWISATGQGVRAVGLIPKTKDKGKYKRRYKAAIEEVGGNPDPANSNISRYCYESYDPEIVIKDFEKCEVFDGIIEETHKEATKRPGISVKINEKEFYRLLSDIVKQGKFYVEGQRHSFIIQFGCNACNKGITQEQTIDFSLEKFSDIPRDEVIKAIQWGYENADFGANKQRITKSNIMQAIQRNEIAANEPDPEPLYYNIWNRNEIAILAGETGVGKSILAVDMLVELALKGLRVLYYDFELSRKQFAERYKGYLFPENFYIAEWDPDPDEPNPNFNFDVIESDIETTGIDIICIDNISALSIKNTVDPDAALHVMRGLKRLQKQAGLSALVLAHVPKRPATNPMTINDLAGSKQLANFADSLFFINFSKLGENTRYIKHVKTRTPQLSKTFGVHLEKDQLGMIKAQFDGYQSEQDHLTGEDVDRRINTAANLRDREGKIQTEIAKVMNISQSTVNRLLKKYDERKLIEEKEAQF